MAKVVEAVTSLPGTVLDKFETERDQDKKGDVYLAGFAGNIKETEGSSEPFHGGGGFAQAVRSPDGYHLDDETGAVWVAPHLNANKLQAAMTATGWVHKTTGAKIDKVTPQNVADAKPVHNIIGKIALNDYFDSICLFMICFNAVWISIDVDHNQADHDKGGEIKNLDLWQAGEWVFVIWFTIEIVIRFLAYKHKKNFFAVPPMRFWNIFDTVLVIIMWVELIVTLMNAGGEGLAALSVLRLLRLLRVTRIFRLIPELGMLVTSMVQAARSVSATFVLIMALMYVFSVIFTIWYLQSTQPKCKDGTGDAPRCEFQPRGIEYQESHAWLDSQDTQLLWTNGGQYNKTTIVPFMGKEGNDFRVQFGDVSASMLTLMQVLCFDDTFGLVRDMYTESVLIGWLMVIFIIIGSFMILNMLIGVLCEVVGETNAEEKEKITKIKVNEVFNEIDKDGGGTIDHAEWSMKGGGKDKFIEMGFDPQVMKDCFTILDLDDGGTLSREEFVGGLIKLLNVPKSLDILAVQKKIEAGLRDLRAELDLDMAKMISKPEDFKGVVEKSSADKEKAKKDLADILNPPKSEKGESGDEKSGPESPK